MAIGAILLAAAGMVAAGQWAQKRNAERDAGISWLWAYSPRTMQSYLVRATVDDGSISFHLEDPKRVEFHACYPGEGEEKQVSCLDQAGQSWDLYY